MNACRESADDAEPEKLQGRIWTRPWMHRLGAVLAIPGGAAAAISASILTSFWPITLLYLTITAVFGPICFIAVEGKVTPLRIIIWAWWPVALPMLGLVTAIRWIRTGAIAS